MRRATGWWWLVVVCGAVGMSATALQIIERIQLAEQPTAKLVCDINATFSCGTVLQAWQSSVFGPIPNPVIGLVVFTIMLTTAVGALLGSQLAGRAWALAAFLALFMLCFTVWYFYETTFSIKAICLYCLFNGTAILLINTALWRIAYAHGWLSREGSRLAFAGRLVEGRTDLFVWGGVWVAVAAMVVLGFS
jgi:uncharacterized membrane protein